MGRSILSRVEESLITALCVVLSAIFGIVVAGTAVIAYFRPKWRREEQEETARRVAAIKETLQKAREERAAAAAAAVATVKDQAASDAQKDTVDLANQFIIDGLKKE